MIIFWFTFFSKLKTWNISTLISKLKICVQKRKFWDQGNLKVFDSQNFFSFFFWRKIWFLDSSFGLFSQTIQIGPNRFDPFRNVVTHLGFHKNVSLCLPVWFVYRYMANQWESLQGSHLYTNVGFCQTLLYSTST